MYPWTILGKQLSNNETRSIGVVLYGSFVFFWIAIDKTNDDFDIKKKKTNDDIYSSRVCNIFANGPDTALNIFVNLIIGAWDIIGLTNGAIEILTVETSYYQQCRGE